MSIPSKLLNERISFRVPFGDEVPWGVDLDGATVTITVIGGVDPYPQRVFWRTSSLDDQVAVIQFRGGVVGVLYNILVTATAGGKAYTKNFRLAILPDSANLPDLFPLTRILTSHPYHQFTQDSAEFTFTVTGGTITLIVKHGDAASDDASIGLEVLTGGVNIPTFFGWEDSGSITFDVTGGTVRLPPYGNFEDANSLSFDVKTGELLIPPLGRWPDAGTIAFDVTSGEVSWEAAHRAIMEESGKLVLTEDGKVLLTEY